MHESVNTWDVTCTQCSTQAGQFMSDHFVHDPNCDLPRRIAGGVIVCCHCGGALHAQRLAATRDTVEPDESAEVLRLRG